MSTTAGTATAVGSTQGNFEAVHIGGAYQQLNTTSGDWYGY